MRRIKIHEVILSLFLALAIAVWFAYFQYQEDKLKVYFFDVGQGDSEMIVAPGANQVLIDGGPDGQVISEIGKAMPFFDRKIELVILTHPHADHLNGLIDVLRRYKVDQIWLTNVNFESDSYDTFKKLVQEKNIPTYSPKLGDKKRFGKLEILTIAPLNDYDGEEAENLNNTSIINKISYGDVSFLMSGDSELEEQEEILKSGIDISAEILKEPHHGSEKVSEDFLKRISPQYVIISCGQKNQYGFPNGETLKKLENIGTKIMRTDQKGTIVFSLDRQGNLILN